MARPDEDDLLFYERRLSPVFRRPWATDDLVAVLAQVPA
jgi:hypothetical protein